MRGILDEAIAICIAILIDPAKRGLNIRRNLFDQFFVASPAVVFTRKNDEERGRVYRAVVTRERDLLEVRHFSMAQFVQDLSRLRLSFFVSFFRLRRGKKL